MARKSIFEILNEELNYTTEIERIEMLLTCSDGINPNTVESFVDQYYFPKWKNRRRCLSCRDMKNQLGIDKILENKKITMQEALMYFEYAANITILCLLGQELDGFRTDDRLIVIRDNIKSILEFTNHEIKYLEDQEMVIVVEKNPAATATADIVDKDTAFKTIEYNHYLLKGNLFRKRDILLALGDKVEPIRKDLVQNGYKTMESDIGFLLNNMNIRHNNYEGKYYQKYTSTLTEEQLEEWYDKTYDVLLLCLLSNNYISLNTDIKALRANYKPEAK